MNKQISKSGVSSTPGHTEADSSKTPSESLKRALKNMLDTVTAKTKKKAANYLLP